MSDDIVERLRARAYRLATKDFNEDGAKLAVEAADELTRLRARLAPVEGEALVEMVAKSDADFDGRPFVGLGRADKDRYLLRARAAIAAIRPHIEAAERERCANVAELCWTGSPDEIAAAIRSGK